MASRKQRLLDNADVGVSASAGIPNRVTTMYALSGVATVMFNDLALVDLVPGQPRVLDGIPAGEKLTVVSAAPGTTMEWLG